jgi:hypothetical protein
MDALEDVGDDGAGADGVYADAVRRKAEGHGLGELSQAAL